jgi:hypothetical protein
MELLCQIGWLIWRVDAEPLDYKRFYCAKSDGRFCRFSLPIVPNRMDREKFQGTEAHFLFCQSPKLTNCGYLVLYMRIGILRPVTMHVNVVCTCADIPDVSINTDIYAAYRCWLKLSS